VRSSAALHRAMQTDLAAFVDLRRRINTVLDEELQVLARRDFSNMMLSIDDAVDAARTRNFALLVLGLIGAALLVVAFVRTVVRPLQALSVLAQRVGAGADPKELPAPSARGDEVGVMQRAFHEMTERLHESQQWLDTLNQDLDRKVRERTKELEQAVAEGQRANESKSAFMANMSHELRTPLNAIIGFSEIIARDLLAKECDARYREYATDINASGQHLLAIVNDLLDVARIDAGKLQIDRQLVPLADIAGECTRLLNGRVTEAGLVIDVEIAPAGLAAWADRRILKQILINLLSNAIKFTPPGGRVQLTACEQDGGVMLKIADTGCGMTPADLTRATTPFFQADSKLSRRHNGAGLGLTLVRGFVEKHDGRFAIDSAPAKGTRVAIWLPREQADGAPANTAEIVPLRRAV
jgi:signal transduction histidine kinase